MTQPTAGAASGSWRVILVLTLLLAGAPALYLYGTGRQAIHNGDEAIYAQMAREMVAHKRLGDLTWQDKLQIVRPPAAVWALAIGHLFSNDSRAVRVPLAIIAGLELALCFLWALALTDSLLWALFTTLLLGTSDLFVGYARYYESEPLLAAWILFALWSYERARREAGWIVGFGIGLAGALLTKQLIGAIPLLVIVADRVRSDDKSPAIPLEIVGKGLFTALLVWLPWHIYAATEYGFGRFFQGYIWQNIFHRAQTPFLRITHPTFYLKEMWRSEGALALLFALAALFTLVRAIRRRHKIDLLLAAWWWLGFLLFSASASRYDYYLLVLYPAAAMMTCRMFQAMPWPRSVQLTLASLTVAISALIHLPQNLNFFRGENELRRIARQIERTANFTAAPVYVYNQHAYLLRYYLSRPVTTLLESAEDLRLAQLAEASGMPAAVELAENLPQTLEKISPPYFLVFPKARHELLANWPDPVLFQSDNYQVYRRVKQK